jgi:glucose-1-phosphate cytidylyltransferase
MQAIILCGGKGTRLREETEFKPKPMVPIGDRPILWHIMKRYATHGIEDFVLCLGYKAEHIREYFLNYDVNNSNVVVQLGSKRVQALDGDHAEKNWRVWLVDTGAETLTGGRVKVIGRYVEGPTFMVTYGDGVADIDFEQLLRFHKKHGKLATVTAVRPSSRFGELSFEGERLSTFQEKPQVHEGWINGGFFVFQREVLDLISGDSESLEAGLLHKLATMNQLEAYRHLGFWQCMDTFREMQILDELWASGRAPWKNWGRGRADAQTSS